MDGVPEITMKMYPAPQPNSNGSPPPTHTHKKQPEEKWALKEEVTLCLKGHLHTKSSLLRGLVIPMSGVHCRDTL